MVISTDIIGRYSYWGWDEIVVQNEGSRHERRLADTEENASRPGRRDSYSVLRIA